MPITPGTLSQWLSAAEDEGTLAKLPGGPWHPYRREWASERMHLPLKAVAEAGGWKDTATLLSGAAPSSCPAWARTRTLLIQSQTCCQLHQGAILWTESAEADPEKYARYL